MNESDPRSNLHYLGSSENKAIHVFIRSSNIYDFHIFLTIYSITSQVYLEPTS